MPKAENDQGEVESTTGTEPTAKTEPTKVVDLTAEKAPTPNEDGAAEQTNGVSTSLKRKSTGDGPEEGAQAEKAQRLSAEEVGEEKVSDPEGSSDAPVTQPDGAEAAEFEKVPPWVHSDVHPSEIGWRMGELEQYKFDFWDWFMTLSDAEQQRFKDKYPPPEEWADFYENESENEDDDVEGDEAEPDGAQ